MKELKSNSMQDIMKVSNEIIHIFKKSVSNDELKLDRSRFNYIFSQLVKINNIAHKETIEIDRVKNL